MATAWVKVIGVLPCLALHVSAHRPNATFPPWSPRRHSVIGAAACWPSPGCRARNSAGATPPRPTPGSPAWPNRLPATPTRHLALVAVGGYGRSSLCPYSDLDVVLVHNGHRDIAKVADAIWYPVWDEGVHLDHSVRRPSEVLTAAAEDVRVALGLLDGRLVWGDARDRRAAPREGPCRLARPARCALPPTARAADGRAPGHAPATWPSCSSPTSRRATAACATSACCGPSRPSLLSWPTTPT